mmetsp:Transcript_23969/g.39024  ORF Transcript_23969/g.39024 Transcript_23969/m.39024 type:complete len:85 (-) Transcript_23969:1252-1506(-)
MKKVRMRVATEEEVKALQQQQQERLRQLQQQPRRLEIKSVAKSRQRNKQAQPISPLQGNVIVKKIRTQSHFTQLQLRAVIQGGM